MTQNEKELLLKDLCARLPYGVRAYYSNYDSDYEIESIKIISYSDYKTASVHLDMIDCTKIVDIDEIKPYLFPLSSMTEEQKKEYNGWKHAIPVCHYEYGDVVEEIELYDSPASFDYLIENHFDYYGLISMGLANNATGLNIY